MVNENNQKYTVYMHVFPDGKKYIGCTRQDAKRRWHKGGGYKQKSLSEAIREYGWDNIDHIIVAKGLSEEEAQSIEKQLIAEYKTQDRNFGYNTKDGGQVFGEHSQEFLDALRERMVGNTYCVGRKISQEHIEALRKSRIGVPKPSPFKGQSIWSDEDKKIMSERAKERWRDPAFREKCKNTHPSMAGENNPMFGKHHSDETKEKIRQKALGRKVSEERRMQMSELARKRKVNQFSKEMDLIATYNSIREAADTVNAKSTNIGFCCRNKNRTCKGYYWRYADEDN